MLRDVETKIKLKRERENKDWTRHDAGLQRSIEELETERARLLDEISRTPSTREERELEALRSYKYTVTAEDKEQIEWLYNVAMSAYNELYLAKERISVDIKETAKAMEKYRSELLRAPLLSMGRDYIDRIKKETDALCEEG